MKIKVNGKYYHLLADPVTEQGFLLSIDGKTQYDIEHLFKLSQKYVRIRKEQKKQNG